VASVLGALSAIGTASKQAPDGSAWIRSERWSLSRYPLLPAPPPAPDVTRFLFRGGRTAVIDYLVDADGPQGANAYLYLFRAPAYSIDALPETGRRAVRKAMRELRIGWITHAQVMEFGLAAFADTRSRVGLSDGTLDEFRRRFRPLRDVPGYHYVGAWKGDELAAFMTVHAVGKGVTTGAYANLVHGSSRPNDGLFHFVLDHCINQCGLEFVSYGLSSVQEESNADTLHKFKLKVGFEAVPVRRVFRVHPWVGPLVNRGSQGVLHGLLRVMPRNRVLKKASGVMAQLLSGGGPGTLPAPE
jgi:hypothetical protein